MKIRFLELPFVLLALLAIAANWTYADEPAPKEDAAEKAEADKQPDDKQDPSRRWQDRVSRSQRAREAQRNHDTVKAAFVEVVSPVRNSTAAIFVGKDQLALGTIVDASGFVLTKLSEIPSDGLECRLADGRKLAARIVGIHDDTDLAMLKIDTRDLSPVLWSDSETPVVGSWLVTPGPEERRSVVSIGVVSAAPRNLPAPSGMLGIRLDDDERGVRIDQVLPGSAAEKAELHVNDIVLSINGKAVRTPDELIREVSKHSAGREMRLSILRNDETLSITATLGDRSLLAPGGQRQDFQRRLGSDVSNRSAGFPSALQHDSVLKANECGGPIIDLDGRVIGINIARSSRVASYALPAAVITPLLDDLKSGKLAPQLAVSERLEELNKSLAQVEERKAQLAKSIADLEQRLAAATEAEAKAKDNADNAPDEFKTAIAERSAAEKALEQAKADLARVSLELQSLTAERVSLEKSE